MSMLLDQRALRINWGCANGKPWDEWLMPEYVPIDQIRLSVTGEDLDKVIQVFIGQRVIGRIHHDDLLHCFRRGEGYEYIEEWKQNHCLFLVRLRGRQLLHITELLRKFGHEHQG